MNNIPLKQLHLWIGIIGLIAFVLSGQYFQHALGGLKELDDAPRLLLRTSHVYLFLTSVINLVFGLYYTPPEKIRWFTIYNQSLIMLSPFVVAYSFATETLTNTGIDRPFTLLAMVLILAWIGNIGIGKAWGCYQKRKNRGAP